MLRRVSRETFLGAVLFGFALLFPIWPASADVFGRLKIIVVNSDNGKPISGAKIIIHDLTHVRPDKTLNVSEDGSVTTDILETHLWGITAVSEKFESRRQEVSVAADVTQEVRIALEPAETTITVTGERNIIKASTPSQVVSRDRQFIERFPLSNANPQQLNGLLLTTPGMVQDSANQIHPRGEHSATSINIQGFQLGGANQGRFGPIIDPRALENVDIITGGYAPEYGSQSAAILNTSIRSGPMKPEQKFEFGGGNYGTADFYLSAGGQAGAPIGTADSGGNQKKTLAYFLSASGHRSENALEPPQPHHQTSHNRGESGTLLGKLDFQATENDAVTLILNAAPARTEIANRNGLPDSYAPFGQGFGFGGALSAADAEAGRILSQQEAGQDTYQTDLNDFGVLQWRHAFDDQVSSMLSVGFNRSYLDVNNKNPRINLDGLPADNAIEYNPSVERHANHFLAAGSLTAERGTHTFKAGGSLDIQNSDDSYELIPGSQLALNALNAADSRLAPPGEPQVDSNGDPLVDSLGNQIYLTSPAAQASKLSVHSSGHYNAAYLQDTWRISEKFTANYGVRFDDYRQKQNLDRPSMNKIQFSPRLNLSYALTPALVVKTSYNRLFIDPPLSQGSVIGDPISPERVHQFDLSVERQLTRRQRAKLAFYDKQIKNQIDTGLLIPSTQLGIFTSVNLERTHVHGIEASYDVLPAENGGTSVFANYSYSVAKPSGVDNTGAAVPEFSDHDQRHTVSGGAGYTFESGLSFAFTQYYGSGMASSALTEDGPRKERYVTNVSVSSNDRLLWGSGGLKLSVNNLLDDRSRINFNSPFSGTRFQQGRSLLLSAFFAF